MNPFKQLRIRAYLQTGVISDQFLPLDGILYAQMIRKELGEKYISKSGESNIREGLGFNLPIKMAGPKSEAWFYHCSFAQWPKESVEDNTFYVKRFDLNYSGYISDKKAKVDTSRGQFKAYHINIYYRHALYVEWYCTGIPEKLQELLKFCTHLGKKTSQGWGSVLRWEMTEWPHDWAIRGENNKLMRAVPVKENGFLYGIRPSYWNERHIFPCLMPFIPK